jgi:hypothetical protein
MSDSRLSKLALLAFAALNIGNAQSGLKIYEDLKAFRLGNYAVAAENLTLQRDRVRMEFTGTFYLAEPVVGHTQGAVFVGRGTVRAEPPPGSFERENVRRMLDADLVESDFRTAVLRFTDDTFSSSNTKPTVAAPPPEALDLAARFEKRFLKETGGNIAARLALSLLNQETPGFFLAEFDKGKPGRFTYTLDFQGRTLAHSFNIDAGEVGLIFAHRPPSGNDVWLAFPSLDDYKSGRAHYTSAYDLARVERYNMTIDVRDPKKSLKLSASMEGVVTAQKVRAIPFSVSEGLSEIDDARLKKAMRVTTARLANGAPVEIAQENWEGGFTVFLPSALDSGASFTLATDLEGDFMRSSSYTNAAFYPILTSGWYPRHGSLNRSRYELTFRHRKEHKVVSIGVRQSEEVDSNAPQEMITRWQMDIPVTLATFSVGAFQRASVNMPVEGRNIQAEFYWPPTLTVDLPDLAKPIEYDQAGLQERAKDIQAELRNYLGYFSSLFGTFPYPSIRVLDAPGRESQGFPTMVLRVPFSSHLPHETAHQWWGDLVSWRSYRDQWLSEGFAEYSQYLVPVPNVISATTRQAQDIRKDMFRETRANIAKMRRSLLDRPQTELGIGKKRLADIGPLILGHRLETRETLGAYDTLIYTKGALVLRMLHFLFSDPASGSGEPFFAMMRDFVKRYENQAATTDGFFEVAGEHFVKTPIAQKYNISDLGWFVSQWVESAYLPTYRLEYSVEDQPDKSVIVRGTIYQDNVPDSFVSFLPVAARLGKDRFGRLIAAVRGPQAPFAAKLPERPEDLQLDPDSWILSERTSTRRVR